MLVRLAQIDDQNALLADLGLSMDKRYIKEY
jgi:hypothetical protein